MKKVLSLVVVVLMVLAFMAGCGSGTPATPAAPSDATAPSAAPAQSSTGSTGQGHPLAGKSVTLSILGIGGWLPSALSQQMGEELFTKYAKENYGYDVKVTFAEAPFDSLFQKAATSLASQSNEYNIIISDSQWLGALSEPGWILKLNDLIKANPNLDAEWYSKSAAAAYQNYPDGISDIWGLPQEADVLIMYVRADLFTDSTERANFKAKYGWDLPSDSSIEQWEDIDFEKYKQICEFFTRPDQGLYGTTIQYSKVYDYLTGSFYPFIWSAGGEIWDPSTRKIEGVLNTEDNAKALALSKSFMQYCPPGAIDVDIAGIVDNYTSGKVATAWQWAAMGGAMTSDKGDTWAVILPGYRMADGTVNRCSSLGGQPWVINAYNTPDQMQVVTDFLNWWYSDETQLEFAKRGGNPLKASVLNSDGFEEIQPWFTAFKYMMQEGNSKDFWHEPTYAELLATQQEAWSQYMAGNDGSVETAKAVLDDVASKQQAIIDK